MTRRDLSLLTYCRADMWPSGRAPSIRRRVSRLLSVSLRLRVRYIPGYITSSSIVTLQLLGTLLLRIADCRAAVSVADGRRPAHMRGIGPHTIDVIKWLVYKNIASATLTKI